MGSAGSVQFNSSAEALARAAESASKPAIVVQLIRKEEIDVATALSLDEPTVNSLVQRRIDGKKIMGALRQMRSVLHSSVRDGICEDPGNIFLAQSPVGATPGTQAFTFAQQQPTSPLPGMRQNVLSPTSSTPREQTALPSSGRSPYKDMSSGQRKSRLRETKETISGAERECNFLLVIDTMRNSPEDPKIQRMCCGAIGGIAREMPDKTPLVRAGALECVAKALGDHARDNTVVSMGCWAIWSPPPRCRFIQFDKAELCRDIRYGDTPPP